MKTFVKSVQHLLSPSCLWAFVVLAAGLSSISAAAFSSGQAIRVVAEVNSNERAPLAGSRHPLAQAQNDQGRMAAGTRLDGVTVFFSRTQRQQAEMNALIKAQQDPASPLFHKWLTPEQFGKRFGLADADIAKVQGWLEQQGFSVDSVARGKDSVRFSGTVGQVEAAFATEIHSYAVSVGGQREEHFAAAKDLSVPAALAPVILGVRNLDNFKPRSMMRKPTAEAISRLPNPYFTSGSSGNHFLAPGDVTTIYNVQALTHGGIDGTGQTIAILGQSAVLLSDIAAFQTAAGLTLKAPTLQQVPNTGVSTIFSGDEGESDLDLEWSSALAPGATILFVYTGSISNNGVFDAEQYTVDNNLAQIISISYGVCEFDLGAANAASLELVSSRAATQGQSIVAASGDDGSTTCYTRTTDTLAQRQALNVSYPASSPFVTAVGGTEFSEGTSTGATQYWTANGSTDVVASAKSYIPEMVWNDDSSAALAASGGGVSTLFTAKPSWQKGVPGIPADGARDVPDIALASSNNHDPYLLCTSDTSNWNSGQSASCDLGFRDSASTFLTAAGGTSFATPVFAGMVALINQKQNYNTGQGLLNTELYKLAANAGTYSSVFHDIKTGTNACLHSTGLCSAAGESGYAATTGYDQATGLGSFDVNALAGAWASSGSALVGTTTTVTASNTAPLVNTNVSFTVAVTSSTGATVPTGGVTITVDGGTAITGNTLTANGTFAYTTQFTTAGAHGVVVAYLGDATHAASTGSTSVTVGGGSSGSGTFTLAATNISVARGSAGTSTVTVTPAGGYKGTVAFTLATTSSSLSAACYSIANATVTGTTAVTTTLTIDTNAQSCATTGAVRKGKSQAIRVGSFGAGGSGPFGLLAGGTMLAGLLLAGLLGRGSRKLRVLAGVILLASFGFVLAGCGGGGGSSGGTTYTNPPTGTYAVTLTGTDTASAAIPAATASLTLTIQ